jgi:hypothetical protein
LEPSNPDPGKHPLLLVEDFGHCPTGFFFIQLEKVFPALQGYKSGLGTPAQSSAGILEQSIGLETENRNVVVVLARQAI